MTTLENTHLTLIEALIAAQSEFPGIPKEAMGQARGGKYPYATLPAVLEAVVPSLNKHGIALIQRTAVEGESLTLHTILRHTSGEEVESVVPLPMPASWQDWGSAMTYARRYSITALAGVAPDDDDDGARAQGAPKAVTRPAEDHGVCADHGVPWKRYQKATDDGKGVHVWFSHAPLEAGGRWHQCEDSRPDAGEKPSLAEKAAEIAAARTPMPASAVPASSGAAKATQAVPKPQGNAGEFASLAKDHGWSQADTVKWARAVASELTEKAVKDWTEDDYGMLVRRFHEWTAQETAQAWSGMPPATAENTREV